MTTWQDFNKDAEMDNLKDNIELVKKEIKRLKKLLKLHQEYEELMGKELDEVCGLAYVHGWKSSRYEAGKELRAEIEALEKERE